MDPKTWLETKYNRLYHGSWYNTPPDEMTIKTIKTLAGIHGDAGWSIQIDDRWSEEQKIAYLETYDICDKARCRLNQSIDMPSGKPRIGGLR